MHSVVTLFFPSTPLIARYLSLISLTFCLLQKMECFLGVARFPYYWNCIQQGIYFSFCIAYLLISMLLVFAPVAFLTYLYYHKSQSHIHRNLNLTLFSIFTIYIVNCYFTVPSKPKQLKAQHASRYKCRLCNEPRFARTHHCSKCRKCFFMMDHHCLMLGTCIGLQNYKGYLQTLVSLKLLSIHVFLERVVVHLKKGSDAIDKSVMAISGTVLLVTLLMVRDQVVGLKLNQTVVESFKYETGDIITFRECLKRRIGLSPIRWILPQPAYSGEGQIWQEGEQQTAQNISLYV